MKETSSKSGLKQNRIFLNLKREHFTLLKPIFFLRFLISILVHTNFLQCQLLCLVWNRGGRRGRIFRTLTTFSSQRNGKAEVPPGDQKRQIESAHCPSSPQLSSPLCQYKGNSFMPQLLFCGLYFSRLLFYLHFS